MAPLTRLRLHLRSLPPRHRAVLLTRALFILTLTRALTHVVPSPAGLLLDAVAPARTIALHEVRRAGATTITLTGVEITPSNVRVFLRASGGTASGRPDGYALLAFLTLPNGSTGGCPALSRAVSGGGPACRGLFGPADHIGAPPLASYPYTLDIPVAAYGAHGAATLVVYTRLIKLHDKRTPTPTGGYIESFTARYVDPISFHLTLTAPPGRAVGRPHLP